MHFRQRPFWILEW